MGESAPASLPSYLSSANTLRGTGGETKSPFDKNAVKNAVRPKSLPSIRSLGGALQGSFSPDELLLLYALTPLLSAHLPLGREGKEGPSADTVKRQCLLFDGPLAWHLCMPLFLQSHTTTAVRTYAGDRDAIAGAYGRWQDSWGSLLRRGWVRQWEGGLEVVYLSHAVSLPTPDWLPPSAQSCLSPQQLMQRYVQYVVKRFAALSSTIGLLDRYLLCPEASLLCPLPRERQLVVWCKVDAFLPHLTLVSSVMGVLLAADQGVAALMRSLSPGPTSRPTGTPAEDPFSSDRGAPSRENSSICSSEDDSGRDSESKRSRTLSESSTDSYSNTAAPDNTASRRVRRQVGGLMTAKEAGDALLQWRGHLKVLSLRLPPTLCSLLAAKLAQLVEAECEGGHRDMRAQSAPHLLDLGELYLRLYEEANNAKGRGSGGGSGGREGSTLAEQGCRLLRRVMDLCDESPGLEHCPLLRARAALCVGKLCLAEALQQGRMLESALCSADARDKKLLARLRLGAHSSQQRGLRVLQMDLLPSLDTHSPSIWEDFKANLALCAPSQDDGEGLGLHAWSDALQQTWLATGMAQLRGDVHKVLGDFFSQLLVCRKLTAANAAFVRAVRGEGDEGDEGDGDEGDGDEGEGGEVDDVEASETDRQDRGAALTLTVEGGVFPLLLHNGRTDLHSRVLDAGLLEQERTRFREAVDKEALGVGEGTARTVETARLARSDYLAAMDAYQALYGEQSLLGAEAGIALAHLHLMFARVSQARGLFEGALKSFKYHALAARQPPRAEVGHCWLGLATIHGASSESRLCLSLCQKALSVYKVAHPPTHYCVLLTAKALLAALEADKRYVSAQELLLESVAAARQTLRRDRLRQQHLQRTRQLQGRGNRGSEGARLGVAAELHGQTLHATSADLGSLLVQLGSLYDKTGQHHLAVPLYKEAIVCFRGLRHGIVDRVQAAQNTARRDREAARAAAKGAKASSTASRLWGRWEWGQWE
ncbi:hypothetical protein B484DRAFT_162271 [Ochromonadaceae sp. CCMP2298]|nr:hypothetical protein B484DRAFT_162271 [Ochromonadaceae sp. CCMP2298]